MQKWEHNIAFHLTLESYAGNPYMLNLLADTLRVTARASTVYYNYIRRHDPKADRRSHECLLDACEERDYEKAVELLRKDTRELLISDADGA